MRREVRKIENKRKTREEKVLGRGQGGKRERGRKSMGFYSGT